LKADGIGAVVNYRAMHLLTWFREAIGTRPGDFPIAEDIGDKVLSLPFYPGMPVQHIDIVCDRIEHALRRATTAGAAKTAVGSWRAAPGP
jgi:dTDP-4-amino-4,6-dideoxygalactose transaminase